MSAARAEGQKGFISLKEKINRLNERLNERARQIERYKQ